MLENNRKQVKFHHQHLTTEHCRKEMYEEINEESKRVNIDSSKKKACMQQMDYANFEQMVLGANLIPIKGSGNVA